MQCWVLMDYWDCTCVACTPKKKQAFVPAMQDEMCLPLPSFQKYGVAIVSCAGNSLISDLMVQAKYLPGKGLLGNINKVELLNAFMTQINLTLLNCLPKIHWYIFPSSSIVTFHNDPMTIA